MMRVLTKYCIINFNQLEIKILIEAFKDFNPRRYDVKQESTRIIGRFPSKKESRRRLKKLRDEYKYPSRQQYEQLLGEFVTYNAYTKTGRFFHARHDWGSSIDSYGKDVSVRLWDKDPQILLDVVKNYNKVETIEKKPDNLIENKSMMTIYQHHVTKLIKDLEDIVFAMGVSRIQEMDHD